jgi:hypothetical protein
VASAPAVTAVESRLASRFARSRASASTEVLQRRAAAKSSLFRNAPGSALVQWGIASSSRGMELKVLVNVVPSPSRRNDPMRQDAPSLRWSANPP